MKHLKKKVAAKKDDYDSPWKDILENYFFEFLAFFFPKAYRDIDLGKGYRFLDKELKQVVRDAKLGRRYADKLAEVFLTEVVQFQIPKSPHNFSKSEYFSFSDFSKKYSGKSL